MKKILLGLLGVFVLLFLAGVGFYFYAASRFDLVMRKSELPLPEGYEKLDGIKIVLISDLHMTDAFDDLQHFREIVKKINQEEPDIILFAGDFIATDNVERPLSPSRIITRMHMLHAKYGIYAVTGNHDWYSEAGETVSRELRQVGIHLLDNDCATIPGICNIVGVQDQEGPQGVQAERAMQKIAPALPTIALVHRPEYWEAFPGDVKIFFAGHTHGGQLRLPIVRDILLKHTDEEKYPDHDCVLPDYRQLHITYGIGTSWIRVRINCPPEVRLFVCRKGKK